MHRAAHILNNRGEEDASLVRRRFDGLVAAMHRHRGKAGTLADAIGHFRKVARSYKPGLFHCCAGPGLPRTNNDLERLFGAHRRHERRATGRKTASPGMVLRGPVRLVAAALTRLRCYQAHDLALADRRRWSELRHQLEQRRRSRVLRCRFRRDPQAFLNAIERQLCQPALPF